MPDAVEKGAWTPGPWRFDHDWHRIPSAIAPNGKVVASFPKTGPEQHSHTDEEEANALLATAAPEMFEALFQMLEHAEHSTPQGAAAFEQARTALRSAGGRG